ncbi:MAG: SDR family oxidoreductase [Pseudomonadota bacterium]
MSFNKRSTSEAVTEGLDLTGKTAVITGVNSGLGQESMRALAARGAHVIGLARTKDKAETACAAVDGSTEGLACELSDFTSVVSCAQQIKALGKPIDILMTNAGIMAPTTLQQAHGVELQFATNQLGHFILIQQLLDSVKAADAGRIVILSSGAHALTVRGGIDFNNLDASGGYDPWRFYGQSKLANLLTARVLAKELEGSNATANAVHPGMINTNLSRDIGGLFSNAMLLWAKVMSKTIEQGAATQLLVAVHPSVAGVSGEYFSDCRVSKSTSLGSNATLAQKCWDASMALTADYLP